MPDIFLDGGIQTGGSTGGGVRDAVIFGQTFDLHLAVLGEQERAAPGVGVAVSGGVETGDDQRVRMEQRRSRLTLQVAS